MFFRFALDKLSFSNHFYKIISINKYIFSEIGGAMENLDRKWILVKDTKCPDKDTSPATLGLTNMAGRIAISLALFKFI